MNIALSITNRVYTFLLRHRFAHWGNGSHIDWRTSKLKGLKYISVGNSTFIAKGVQLTAWDSHNGKCYKPSITIGDACSIRDNCHITAINGIHIGDNLLTGTNVLITDNSHGEATREQMGIPPTQRELYSKGPVIIGNNVWLGNNVCVMPGVTIGDGAVIGANSVVTHDIPSCSVAAGIPAKIIKSAQDQ